VKPPRVPDIEQANQVERNLFGMTHCQAGALVAAVWGFPENLAACMGEHHIMPAGARGDPRGLIVTACRMADSLGFPRFPVRGAWRPELGAALEHIPQLEPEPCGRDRTAHSGSLQLRPRPALTRIGHRPGIDTSVDAANTSVCATPAVSTVGSHATVAHALSVPCRHCCRHVLTANR